MQAIPSVDRLIPVSPRVILEVINTGVGMGLGQDKYQHGLQEHMPVTAAIDLIQDIHAHSYMAWNVCNDLSIHILMCSTEVSWLVVQVLVAVGSLM